MQKHLLLSSPTKERLISSLNSHFYSTAYSINEQGQVTWKGGEVRAELTYEVKKGIHLVYSKSGYQSEY